MYANRRREANTSVKKERVEMNRFEKENKGAAPRNKKNERERRIKRDMAALSEIQPRMISCVPTCE